MVEILNPNGSFPCLLVCDHASAFIPPDYEKLGLPDAALGKHIALDVGIAPVVRALSFLLDAPAVLASHSRLLIDTNRWIADAESIPEVSDATPVPGNQGLSDHEKRSRQDGFFWPFHAAVDKALGTLRSQHSKPIFVAMHSCTRQLSTGAIRPMDGGTIWHERPNLAHRIAKALTEEFGLAIADNEPYSGLGGTAFTMDYHTWGTGIDALGFEVVNDQLMSPSDQAEWTRFLAKALITSQSDCISTARVGVSA